MIDVRSNRVGLGPRRLRVLVGAIASVAGALAVAGQPASAGAATDVQLRVAHFSPDTPPMDVYATGFDGKEQLVLPKLGYGQVSEYLPLDAGLYAFSMRPAGSPATDEAVLRVSADLAANTSYTFAAFGRQAELNTDLLTDDLSAPPPGQGRVRLIQPEGIALAFDKGPIFDRRLELAHVPIEPGDRLVLVNSGAVVVADEQGKELGEKPLFAHILKCAPLSTEQFLARMRGALEGLAGEAGVPRPISIVTVARRG